MSKAPEKPAASVEVAPVGKSKKKLIIIALAALVLLAVVGGGTAIFLSKKNHPDKEKEHKAEVLKPAVFLPIEPFTVNLQTDVDSSDKYLQVSMTLQVQDDEQVALIKSNMAQVRSRILMLLSSKAAIELTSSEGKELLIEEIVEQLKVPFIPKGEPQKVSSVFFTAFIIQ
jgi:flagellar FliL protein